MGTPVKYFSLLELRPGASREEIRKAYFDLAQVWHPDRFAHNPRLREKAEERFKVISHAYHELVAEKSPHQFGTVSREPQARPRKSWVPRPSRASLFETVRISWKTIGAVLGAACATLMATTYFLEPEPPFESYKASTESARFSRSTANSAMAAADTEFPDTPVRPLIGMNAGRSELDAVKLRQQRMLFR